MFNQQKRPLAISPAFDQTALVAKRGRPSVAPSKVLFFSKLPEDCHEQDLQSLAARFGRVNQVLLMIEKRQAFVEMESVPVAAAVFGFYETVPAVIRGIHVNVSYSRHQQIHRKTRPVGIPTRILLINITQVQQGIPVLTLFKLFSAYGKVQKIVSFYKGHNITVFVEFEGIAHATAALSAMNGRNVYENCNLLSIIYSNLPSITVKSTNPGSFDFTTGAMPAEGAVCTPGKFTRSEPVKQPPLDTSGGYGGVPYRGAVPTYSNFGAGAEYDPYRATGSHPPSYGGAPPPYTNAYAPPPSQNAYAPPSNAYAPPSNAYAPPSHTPYSAIQIPPGGMVVIVSGFDLQTDVLRQLFNLFSFYGILKRIKVMYKKAGTALVQYVNAEGPRLAIENLSGQPWGSGTLKVDISRHQAITGPVPLPGDERNAEYSTSNMHRYRRIDPVQFHRKVCKPTATLHITRLEPELLAKDGAIYEICSRYGQVLQFEIKEAKSHMALVQYVSPEAGMLALMQLHNFRADGNAAERGWIVSFTRSRVQNNAAAGAAPIMPTFVAPASAAESATTVHGM